VTDTDTGAPKGIVEGCEIVQVLIIVVFIADVVSKE
jgi:hypothetical protein